MITDYKQHTALWLKRDLVGCGKLFIIHRNFRVSFKIDGKPESITIIAPFTTDLASIPWWVPKWIAEKVDSHIEAAVIHDYLYVTAMWTKETADEIFYTAMLHYKVPEWRAKAMYAAVRVGGKGNY